MRKTPTFADKLVCAVVLVLSLGFAWLGREYAVLTAIVRPHVAAGIVGRDDDFGSSEEPAAVDGWRPGLDPVVDVNTLCVGDFPDLGSWMGRRTERTRHVAALLKEHAATCRTAPEARHRYDPDTSVLVVPANVTVSVRFLPTRGFYRSGLLERHHSLQGPYRRMSRRWRDHGKPLKGPLRVRLRDFAPDVEGIRVAEHPTKDPRRRFFYLAGVRPFNATKMVEQTRAYEDARRRSRGLGADAEAALPNVVIVALDAVDLVTLRRTVPDFSHWLHAGDGPGDSHHHYLFPSFHSQRHGTTRDNMPALLAGLFRAYGRTGDDAMHFDDFSSPPPARLWLWRALAKDYGYVSAYGCFPRNMVLGITNVAQLPDFDHWIPLPADCPPPFYGRGGENKRRAFLRGFKSPFDACEVDMQAERWLRCNRTSVHNKQFEYLDAFFDRYAGRLPRFAYLHLLHTHSGVVENAQIVADDLRDFVRGLKRRHPNTLVLLMGDHGPLEQADLNAIAFMSMLVPRRFEARLAATPGFGDVHANLLANRRMLVTHGDFYVSILDTLRFATGAANVTRLASRPPNVNWAKTMGQSWQPRNVFLRHAAVAARTPAEAGIRPSFYACRPRTKLSVNSVLARSAVALAAAWLNNQTRPYRATCLAHEARPVPKAVAAADKHSLRITFATARGLVFTAALRVDATRASSNATGRVTMLRQLTRYSFHDHCLPTDGNVPPGLCFCDPNAPVCIDDCPTT